MIAGEFPAAFMVDGAVKDTGPIAAAMRETGTDATLMDAVAQQFRKTADRGHGGEDMAAVIWPITEEGLAVGGAFYSDTASGMMPMAHRVAGVLAFQ